MSHPLETDNSLPLGLGVSINTLSEMGLASWINPITEVVREQFMPGRNGNLPRWLSLLSQLPDHKTKQIDFSLDRVKIGHQDELNKEARERLEQLMLQLAPWRQGPFDLFGIHVNAEWQSNLKWQRLQDAIEPLTDRIILDIGGSNGYFACRMLGAGASSVTVVDPSVLATTQAFALRQFIEQSTAITNIPVPFEVIPKHSQAFDSVFSMGVFYHRKSPFEHLEHLRSCLRPGGQLVFETLIIDGKKGEILVPNKRYAQMPNIWFLPSLLELEHWLERCGFKHINCINQSRTKPDEQRSTAWMTYHSLQDFLDPDDQTKTIEGYPAPLRAIVTAMA